MSDLQHLAFADFDGDGDEDRYAKGDVTDLSLSMRNDGAVPPGEIALMVFGTGRTAWNGMPLPMSMAPAGSPSAAIRRWIQPIPNDPSLVGVRFHNQALVTQPAANPFGAVLSDAATGIVGL